MKAAEWNDHGKEREATTAANSTIGFLSDIIHGLNCGQNYVVIETNFENAFDKFKSLRNHLEIESQYELKKIEPKEEESQDELWNEVAWPMRNISKSTEQAINELKQHFRIERIKTESGSSEHTD